MNELWRLTRAASAVVLLALVAGCPGSGTPTKATEEGSGDTKSDPATSDGASGTSDPSSDGALAYLRQYVQEHPEMRLRDVRYDDEPTQWSQRRRFQNKWKVEGEVPLSMLDASSLALSPDGFQFMDTEHGREGAVGAERARTTDGGEVIVGQIVWNPRERRYEAWHLTTTPDRTTRATRATQEGER